MTAATSNKKPSHFLNRFVRSFGEGRRITFINFILQLLGLPVISLVYFILCKYSYLPDDKVKKLSDTCESFADLGIIMLCAALLSGAVYALFHFSYLYRKEIVDMHYSLPISGTQRFFADYLAGLAGYMIPAFASAVLSLVIVLLCAPMAGDLGNEHIVEIILASIPMTLITMVQFYTICVLAVCFCGNMFESIVSIAVLIGMAPVAVIVVFYNLMMVNSFGIDPESIFSNTSFSATSPVGAVAFWRSAMGDLSSGNEGEFFTASIVRWGVVMLIATLVYLLISWFIYSRRKAEDVSKPFVFESFYYVMMGLAVFAALTLFKITAAGIITGIIICAVVWLIVGLIRHRGLNGLWKSPISFAVTVAVILCLFKFFGLVNGLDLYKNIPDESKIESVGIYLDNLDVYENDYFTDRDVIREAVAMNRAITDKKAIYSGGDIEFVDENELGGFILNSANVKLTFRTYSGKQITRMYFIPTDMTTGLAEAMVGTDTFAYTKASSFLSNFDVESEKYAVHLSAKFSNNEVTRYLSREDVDILRSAYVSDMMEMTMDDVRTMRTVGFINGKVIQENFENTFAAMEELNIAFPEFTMPAGDPDIDPAGEIRVILEPELIFPSAFFEDQMYFSIYFDEPSESKSVICPHCTYFNGYVSHNRKGAYGLIDCAESETLLKNTTCAVIGEKPLALIWYGGKNYFILNNEENRELIQKCLNFDDVWHYDMAEKPQTVAE